MNMISLFLLGLLYRADSVLLTPGTIDELIRENYAVKSERYSTLISGNEFYRSFFSLFFTPQVSITKTQVDDNFPVYSENGEFRLTLFSPLRISSLSRSFFAYKESRLMLEKKHLSKYLEVIDLVFSYEYLMEKVQADSLMLKYARKIYDMASMRLRLGLADSLELLNAKDNLEGAKLTYLEDRNSLGQKEFEVKAALGITKPFVVEIDSFSAEKTNDVNFENAYSVQIAKKEENSARSEEILSWLSLLPEVGITYKKNYTGNNFERSMNNFTTSKTFGVYLTFYPLDFIFNIRRSILERKKSLMNLKDVQINEKENLLKLKDRISFLREKVRMLYTRAEIREKSLTLALEKYGLGEFSLQDVLKEQVDYMNVMSSYFKTKLDLTKLMFKIKLNYSRR